MIIVRKSKDRGHVDHGWLKTYHTFSFAEYYDPNFKGFSVLRVINEDRVAGGEGFGEHPHENMEIVTYVLSGQLAHKDSMGNGSVLKVNAVQRMSAGTGITHSEFNGSKNEEVHILQIWIHPRKSGGLPNYEEKTFSTEEKMNRLRLIVSLDGRDGSLKMNQDASLYASVLGQSKSVSLNIEKGRRVWVQVARGALEAVGGSNSIELQAGDGAAVTEIKTLNLKARQNTEFLVFDLP